MAFAERTAATKGALIRLKDTLKFIESGKDILKMKRDRLAGELSKLLDQMGRREEVDRKLMKAYRDLESVLVSQGYDAVSSAAMSIPKMDLEVLPISMMGAIVPKTALKKRPQINSIQSLSIHQVAEEFHGLISELLETVDIETSIERISYELMMTNRKVNAMEKIVIPAYVKRIMYIEDLLFDEDLEDFARIKRIKVVAGGKKA